MYVFGIVHLSCDPIRDQVGRDLLPTAITIPISFIRVNLWLSLVFAFESGLARLASLSRVGSTLQCPRLRARAVGIFPTSLRRLRYPRVCGRPAVGLNRLRSIRAKSVRRL